MGQVGDIHSSEWLCPTLVKEIEVKVVEKTPPLFFLLEESTHNFSDIFLLPTHVHDPSENISNTLRKFNGKSLLQRLLR